MSKQTLKFNDIVLNKKDYYASKKAIPLNLVNINNIVVYIVVYTSNEWVYQIFLKWLKEHVI